MTERNHKESRLKSPKECREESKKGIPGEIPDGMPQNIPEGNPEYHRQHCCRFVKYFNECNRDDRSTMIFH